MLGILWTIIIGFVAGLVAKMFMGGKNDPSGFIMTAILGIVGAFVAKFIGEAVGWYSAGDSAGFIASVVGAMIVLFAYHMVTRGSSSN